jgi:hypothetical protein
MAAPIAVTSMFQPGVLADLRIGDLIMRVDLPVGDQRLFFLLREGATAMVRP